MQEEKLESILEQQSDLVHTLPHDWQNLIRNPVSELDEAAVDTMFVAFDKLVRAAKTFRRLSILERIDAGDIDLVSLIMPTMRLRVALNALRLRIIDGALFGAPAQIVAAVFARTVTLVVAEMPGVADIEALEIVLRTLRPRKQVFDADALYINELGAICFRRAGEPLLQTAIRAGTAPTLFNFAVAYGIGMLLWFVARRTEIMHSVFNGVDLHWSNADPSRLLADVMLRVMSADNETQSAFAFLIDTKVATYNARLFVFSAVRDVYEMAFRRLAKIVETEPGIALYAVARSSNAARRMLALGALFVLDTSPASEAEANGSKSLSRRSTRERAVHRLLICACRVRCATKRFVRVKLEQVRRHRHRRRLTMISKKNFI